MRLCFIIPPSLFLLDDRVFMTLGILRVAAVCENSGHHVDMLDLSGISNYLDVVRDYLRSHDPDAMLLTATTPQMPAVTNIAHVIRAASRAKYGPLGPKLILGGPHPTLVNAAAKQEIKSDRHGRARRALEQLAEGFDCIVSGDGEEAVHLALSSAAPKVLDADLPNGPLFLTNKRLNELPLPARHLLDVDSYRYTIEGERALSMIAQLGCPYQCTFCGGRRSAMLRRIRTRNTASVLAEIRHLHDTYGAKGFMLYDDELNVNKEMVPLMNGIADMQAELGVRFKLRGFVKSELFSAEQAEAMKRAGFSWILCGYESGSERILTNIRKQATQADNTRCVEIARAAGLKVKALMSLGHAGESAATIAETREWLLRVKPDDLDATIISTFPGTAYYDDAVPHESMEDVWTYTSKDTGDRLHGIEIDYRTTADYYKGDPEGGYRSYVFTDHLTPEQLVAERDALEALVRRELNIPFNPGASAQLYEHSMGQIPMHILRSSSAVAVGAQ